MYLLNKLLILILLSLTLSAGTITVGEDISVVINETATLTATGQCSNAQNTANFEWRIQEKIGDGVFSTESIFWFSPDESWTAPQYHIQATIVCPNETDKSDELIVTISSNPIDPPIEPPVDSGELNITQISIGEGTVEFEAIGACQNNNTPAFEWTIEERINDGVFSTDKFFWFTPNNPNDTYHINVKMICPNETDKRKTTLLNGDGNNNPITLTISKPLTPANCEGEIIESGIDLNNNGILDESEITSTEENYTEGTPITLTQLKSKIANSEDITSVNTCKITNMSGLFTNNTTFNQDIGSWNTGSVKTMSGMFYRAINFDQDISGWDTSKVERMRGMFLYATSFNQAIGSWDTSSVQQMESMFYNASLFNQALNSWNTSNVISMEDMFRQASSFNQNISAWDTSKVQFMSFMFSKATSFNQPLNTWNTSNVQRMQFMFREASSFNQPLDGWNVSKLENMYGMFQGATSFNQNLGIWDISSVRVLSGETDINREGMFHAFDGVPLSTENYDALLIGWSQQNVHPNTLNINAQYSTQATQARELLINNFHWNITDNGQL